MTPTEIIMAACADGVLLALTDQNEALVFWHDEATRTRWEPLLSQNGHAVLELLTAAKAAWPDDSEHVRAWLASIGEQDPKTVADVLERCRTNLHARAYFLALATDKAQGVAWNDDRTRCCDCLHLTFAGVCLLACPVGPVVANRGYRPVDMPRRCEHYSKGGRSRPGGK